MIGKTYLFCAILSLLSLASGATVYYVSEAGDDANSGLSPDAPFLTLHHAVSAANQDPLAEEIVLDGHFTLSSTLEVTGPYCLRGAERRIPKKP